MKIQFKRLPEVKKELIIELMNNQLIRRHMPLLTDHFDLSVCEKFITSKEQLWLEFGFGPRAIIVNNHFAGWGGLQPEQGETDLALVLHPTYWGVGRMVFNEIKNKAFGAMKTESITVSLPPSRTKSKGLILLGFKEDGEFKIGRELFIRYRLENPLKD